jgi:hypothetical protein
VTKCDTETQNKHILLEKKGVDRLIQCRVATDLQFVTNAVSVRRNEGKHNKISYTVSMLYMEICYGDWLTWLWRLVTGSRKPMASFSLSLKVFELGNGPSQTERAILSFFYFFFFQNQGPPLTRWFPLTLGRVIFFTQSTDSNSTPAQKPSHILPAIWASLSPVRLMHKINLHNKFYKHFVEEHLFLILMYTINFSFIIFLS